VTAGEQDVTASLTEWSAPEPETVTSSPPTAPCPPPLARRSSGLHPARWSPAPGGALGPLVLEERIGRGGMGEVWRAREAGGAQVAVKLLGHDWAHDPRGETRLRREHEVLDRLDHPALVRPRATGWSPDGRPWFSMDLVPGARTLSVAGREGLPLERALDVLEQVSDALGHAHCLGVFHRDVKPSNILLDDQGRARLVDFGIVRVTGASRLTSTGDVWGTPGFTAPEQIERPDAVGPWTDVFGLGATLHFLLAGEPPKVPVDERPVAALPNDVPPRLAALCRRALAYDHAARPRDGAAFVAELRAARAPAPPSPPPPRRVPPLLLIAAGAGLTLLAVLSGLLPIGPAPAAPGAATALPPAPASSGGAAPAAVASRAGPPDPLPAGLALGTRVGEVVNLADGSVLVWVPAGTLEMGAAEGDSNEGPVHDVPIEGFFLGKVELDWGHFRAFCEATGRELPDRAIPGEPPFTATDEHPVFNVRLSDAMAYCAWAGLRLPSEAEWEWAARGDDPSRIFPWGPALPLDGTRVANFADRTAERLAPEGFGVCTPEYDDGAFWPTPVGSFPAGASWVGCLDLCGNMWEWTSDRWRHYPGAAPASALVPPGEVVQAVRGGSWDNPVRFVHSTHRGASPPSRRATYLGFRVARDGR